MAKTAAPAAQQAQNPSAQQAQPAQVAFPLASRKMTRFQFNTGAVALNAATATVINPIPLTADGYLSHVELEVSLALTATGAGTFTADGPFNALASIGFKTASGNDVQVPVTGYGAYLEAKYGCQWAAAPYSDLRMGRQYSAPAFAAGANAAHFFLPVSFSIDAATGYGSLPNLASNKSYLLSMTANSLSGMGGANLTAGTITVAGYAYYWSEPPAVNAAGSPQATNPIGNGTVNQWQYEAPVVAPGDRYVKSNSVGNVIRTMILVLRNAAGVRVDADWPALSEVYLDNEPMFYKTQTLWEEEMIRLYGLTAATKDVAQGLDTGVYVLPFHALASSLAGLTANSRSQLLPTANTSQLQIRGTSFGANASALEIYTNSVIPTDPATLYAR